MLVTLCLFYPTSAYVLSSSCDLLRRWHLIDSGKGQRRINRRENLLLALLALFAYNRLHAKNCQLFGRFGKGDARKLTEDCHPRVQRIEGIIALLIYNSDIPPLGFLLYTGNVQTLQQLNPLLDPLVRDAVG